MRIIGYCRYSSDNQRAESIDAQIRAITEYAEREGHTIVRFFCDEARSATTDNRPQFQEMMNHLEECDAIAVHKLDRFSRDRYDSAHYRFLLKKAGVRLISVLEHLDDSPESIILESVLEGMAEYYSRNLAREVMKGLRENALSCKHTGGTPPLGYDLAPDKTYVINETEAEAVRLIFSMHAAGAGYSRIIDELTAKGMRTKTGKTFGKNSIYPILSNEKYTGVYLYNQVEKPLPGEKRNQHRKKKDEDIIRVPDGMPRIISQELWNEVHSKMEQNKKKAGSYKAKETYLLSGHIFCGLCGGTMAGCRVSAKGKSTYAYYQCINAKQSRTCKAKMIRKDYIEGQVLQILYDNVFKPAAIDAAAQKIFDYAKTRCADAPDYIKASKKELAKTDTELRNMVDAIAAGMFQPSMKEKMDNLEAKKAALKIRIAEAERQERLSEVSLDEIKEYLSGYQELLSASPEKQKKVINEFVYKVTVFEDHVDIDVTPWKGKSPIVIGDEAFLDSDGGDGGARTRDLFDVNEAL